MIIKFLFFNLPLITHKEISCFWGRFSLYLLYKNDCFHSEINNFNKDLQK